MLYTIAIILLLLWFLGIIGIYTIGWFIHVLLIIAVVLIVVRLMGAVWRGK